MQTLSWTKAFLYFLLCAGERTLTGLHTQVMGKNKVLVKVHPEGKYVVDLDKSIDIAQVWLLINLAYVHRSNCCNS